MAITLMNTKPRQQLIAIERMKNTTPKQGDVFVLVTDTGHEHTVVVVRLSPSVCTFIDIPSWDRFTEYSFYTGRNLYEALEGTQIVDFRPVEQISNITLN